MGKNLHSFEISSKRMNKKLDKPIPTTKHYCYNKTWLMGEDYVWVEEDYIWEGEVNARVALTELKFHPTGYKRE